MSALPGRLLLSVCAQDALEHPWCDLVYLTDVMAEFDCNVFFPEFDRELFKVQERYVFVCYLYMLILSVHAVVTMVLYLGTTGC